MTLICFHVLLVTSTTNNTLNLRDTRNEINMSNVTKNNVTKNNVTKNNETVIRWYNDVEYTITELLATRKNDVIEGMGLVEIIKHVLEHGSFNPTCSATGNKRFGLAIKLVNRGVDASEYTSDTMNADREESISPKIVKEIDALERKIENAEERLWSAKYSTSWDYRRVDSIKAHITFLERRLKEVYKKAYRNH